MALKDTWVDLVDGVDNASAKTINKMAKSIIDLEDEEQAGGKDGLSAYEIAVKNGFKGTETEWLESLKGEDGKTPVKGVDYYTEEDKQEFYDYINETIGLEIDKIEAEATNIEEELDEIISHEEAYIGGVFE